jgi:hypothetical protein
VKATCARGAAGALYASATLLIVSSHREEWLKRLRQMQLDMDRIAAGVLPARGNGRNATASDVQAYLNARRETVRA